jgi:hypothetical protein
MLLLADGQTFCDTSQQVGLGERHLRKWAKRFIAQGISGLYESKRPGRPPVFSSAKSTKPRLRSLLDFRTPITATCT